MCLAVPGKILSVSGNEPLERMGRVSFGGIVKEVSLAYTPEANAGDYVIVHVGFAISRLDEAEAHRVFEYLRQITGGVVNDARLRQYVDAAPEMMEFLEKLSPWFEFVWKPGYADYYPELPGGSELGSTINVPAIDLRKLGDEEENLLHPLALAPKGIWFAPKDLRLFYQVRQNWRGKAVLVKLIWRMFRARVFGDRMAAIGQSLAARMRLALKQQGVPLWLNSPMTELITDVDGTVTGAVVERDGGLRRIHARRGVILASGGFDHDIAWRRQHLPVLEKDWSFGNPAAMGDGIRAGEKVGGSTDLLDEAWWFPAICWPDGRLQFMLNERMMPSQFVVNGDGKRFINEGLADGSLKPIIARTFPLDEIVEAHRYLESNQQTGKIVVAV